MNSTAQLNSTLPLVYKHSKKLQHRSIAHTVEIVYTYDMCMEKMYTDCMCVRMEHSDVIHVHIFVSCLVAVTLLCFALPLSRREELDKFPVFRCICVGHLLHLSRMRLCTCIEPFFIFSRNEIIRKIKDETHLCASVRHTCFLLSYKFFCLVHKSFRKCEKKLFNS